MAEHKTLKPQFLSNESKHLKFKLAFSSGGQIQLRCEFNSLDITLKHFFNVKNTQLYQKFTKDKQRENYKQDKKCIRNYIFIVKIGY